MVNNTHTHAHINKLSFLFLSSFYDTWGIPGYLFQDLDISGRYKACAISVLLYRTYDVDAPVTTTIMLIMIIL